MIYLFLGWFVLCGMGPVIMKLATKAGYTFAEAMWWVVLVAILGSVGSGLIDYGHSVT